MEQYLGYFNTNDGVRLAYFDMGQGEPVVLINGYACPAVGWKYHMERLAEAGYRAIAFDRRGHGASDRPAWGQRMSRQGMDLHLLLEHLGLERPVLVGQSMGASSIFAYLSLFGENRVRAVVDIDQSPKLVNDSDWQWGMYGLDRETLSQHRTVPKANYRELPHAYMAEIAELTKGYSPFSAKATKNLVQDSTMSDWRDVLSRLTLPALFVAGEKSPYWPWQHAVSSAELCQNGRAVVVEACGHNIHYECLEQCGDILLEFLASLP